MLLGEIDAMKMTFTYINEVRAAKFARGWQSVGLGAKIRMRCGGIWPREVES